MHVIVLVLALFFYSSTDKVPLSASVVVPNAAACNAMGPILKARYEAQSGVQVAIFRCFDVGDGDGNKS